MEELEGRGGVVVVGTAARRVEWLGGRGLQVPGGHRTPTV